MFAITNGWHTKTFSFFVTLKYFEKLKIKKKKN